MDILDTITPLILSCFCWCLLQVKLSCSSISEYVIRTQPSKHGLSTIESVAHAIAWLDSAPDIVEVRIHTTDYYFYVNNVSLFQTLVRPLRALCQHQLDHGAVVHHSKDHPDYISIEQYVRTILQCRVSMLLPILRKQQRKKFILSS